MVFAVIGLQRTLSILVIEDDVIISFGMVHQQVKQSTLDDKESVLLRRAISLKVICEKEKFSNCAFCKNVCEYE